MMKKKRILITNDDGIDAPGIQALHEVIRHEYDVLVVAPMYEKSGAGCSLSLANEMEVQRRSNSNGVWGYAVNGTPADCVKFAITTVEDFEPDFVLSGINRGMNAGNSVFYSGTVAGAIEATLFHYPAMACSLMMDFRTNEPGLFDEAARVVRGLLPWLLEQEHERRTLWNLNMPNLPAEKMGPVRFTTHGTSFFVDDFARYREDGDTIIYKNVGTKLVECAIHNDSDDRAVTNGEVSLSLLRTNLTVDLPHAAIKSLEEEWNRALKSKK